MALSVGILQCFLSSCRNILQWLDELPKCEQTDKIRKEIEAIVKFCKEPS